MKCFFEAVMDGVVIGMSITLTLFVMSFFEKKECENTYGAPCLFIGDYIPGRTGQNYNSPLSVPDRLEEPEGQGV